MLPFGQAFTVLQRADVRGEELQSALDTSIVLAYLRDVLECFVVQVYAELGGPKVTA